MSLSLLGLGSNLGQRRRQLSDALTAIGALPKTRLIARSRVYETTAIGGAVGDPGYLNAAVCVATQLPPAQLWLELSEIERRMGRRPREPWSSRTLDIDVLLYDRLELNRPELTLPHPRMEYRRFVLEPASEAAPWMRHPSSGWTTGQLLRHLNRAEERIAVAALDVATGEAVISHISAALRLRREDASEEKNQDGSASRLAPSLFAGSELSQQRRPKLIIGLACDPAAGEFVARDRANRPSASATIDALYRSPTGEQQRRWRRILKLPKTGPIAWVDPTDATAALRIATAAVQAVWPELV